MAYGWFRNILETVVREALMAKKKSDPRQKAKPRAKVSGRHMWKKTKFDDVADFHAFLEEALGVKLAPFEPIDGKTNTPITKGLVSHLSETEMADFVASWDELPHIARAAYIDHFRSCASCAKLFNAETKTLES